LVNLVSLGHEIVFGNLNLDDRDGLLELGFGNCFISGDNLDVFLGEHAPGSRVAGVDDSHVIVVDVDDVHVAVREEGLLVLNDEGAFVCIQVPLRNLRRRYDEVVLNLRPGNILKRGRNTIFVHAPLLVRAIVGLKCVGVSVGFEPGARHLFEAERLNADGLLACAEVDTCGGRGAQKGSDGSGDCALVSFHL